jgi:phage/plasmid-like protein (TIGR03299 family)
MSHEIESALFSAREGAGWTGLGRAIPDDIARDPRKIAELLGATWTVQTREAFFKAAPGTEHERYLPIPGAAVQVRSDNGHVLSVTSDTRYHVDNRQPSDILEAFRDQLNASKLEISHAAVLRGGAIIAVSALLPSEFDMNVSNSGVRDAVKRYVTLSTGYDKKNGTKRARGFVRVVCANTWAASVAESEGAGTLKTIRASTHIANGDLSDMLANMEADLRHEQSVYDGLANRAMSDVDVTRYFADVLEIKIEDLGRVDKTGKSLVSSRSRNMLKELTDAYVNGPGAHRASGTAWGAFNAATYYATHVKTARDTSNANDGAVLARVASNMTGDSQRLKARALELLTRVAVAA